MLRFLGTMGNSNGGTSQDTLEGFLKGARGGSGRFLGGGAAAGQDEDKKPSMVTSDKGSPKESSS